MPLASNEIKTPKHKYELGDTFYFPSIVMTQYESNKPKESAKFIDCIAVIIKADDYDISINNKVSKIFPVYYIEIEDKYVTTNGITFTMQVDENFLNVLPRTYAEDNKNKS